MSLPPGFLDDLRDRVRVSEVVARRVSWDARRSNAAKGDFWACCPFHEERTPSFHVEDRRGFYNCFGCGAKGDAVSFLREREGLGFMEAVEELARMAGVEMPARDPDAAAKLEKRRGLVEWMEEAVRIYRGALSGSQAVEARAYLARRGLSQQALDRFEIGYAPPGRDTILRALTAKGATPEALVEAGLCKRPEEGGAPFDRFRDRIMFPIRDVRGRCVAFGGRAMSPDAYAKYLNSPETPLFSKSRTLFNHGPARAAATKAGALIVAEGYMDVIALVEAGFEHAVAPLGTAVTEAHLDLLWGLAPEPVIALDGDRAGRAAALRVADHALPKLEAGRSLRFALLPEGRDPDDLLRTEGADALAAVLARAEPMSALLWRREVEGKSFDSPERRAALDARLRVLLDKIGDRSLREHYRRDFGDRRSDLFAERRAAKKDAAARRVPRANGRRDGYAPPPAPSAETLASLLARGADARLLCRAREAAILLALANHPSLAERWLDEAAAAEFLNPDLDMARGALISALLSETPGAIYEPDPATRRLVEAAATNLAGGFTRKGAPLDTVEAGLAEALRRHAAERAFVLEIEAAAEALRTTPGAELDGRLREAVALLQSALPRPPEEDDAAARDREGLLRSIALAEQLIERRRARSRPNH